jgi:RNA polymerase sigma factor (sigma-70 family)
VQTEAGRITEDAIRFTRQAWRTLLQRVIRRTGQRERAEDFLQAAFIKLAEHRSRHEVRSTEAFLVTAATHIAIDEHRRQKVRNEAGDQEEILSRIADARPLQDEVLIARKRLEGVRAAIDALPPRTREVFLMHRLEGAKYREIAIALGISQSAVEKHIARAALLITEWSED